MKMMNLPRCGRPDVSEPCHMKKQKKDRTKRYVLSGHKWNMTDLTYGFENYPTRGPSKMEVEEAAARAMKRWSQVSGLTFTKGGANSDIKILFVAGAHYRVIGDTGFDGGGGVLAHAFLPPWGDAHFDDDETFAVNSPNGISFEQVLTHEVGHTIGLNHSTVGASVMKAIYTGTDPDFQLHPDDIAGVQALYGPAPQIEGVYDGYGSGVLFTNRAKNLELKVSVDNSASGCPPNTETALCAASMELATPAGLTTDECRLTGSDEMTATISLDITPSSSGYTLRQLAALINKDTLDAIYNECSITSTSFTFTPFLCPELGQQECDAANADCVPLSAGYTCNCKPGYRTAANSNSGPNCISTQAPAPAPAPASNIPAGDSPGTLSEPMNGIGTDLIIGLSVGGGVVLLFILVVAVCVVVYASKTDPPEPYFYPDQIGPSYAPAPYLPPQAHRPRPPPLLLPAPAPAPPQGYRTQPPTGQAYSIGSQIFYY